MLTLEAFRAAVKDQLGDVLDLVRDEQIDGWINRGRQRLGYFDSKRATLTWDDLAASVPLPADCISVDRIVPDPSSVLPAHLVARSTVEFLDPSCVTGGSATLYYRAEFADVTSISPSLMPRSADEAAISYALARFFQRLAGNRADFRRYVTITGQGGVDVQDLTELAAVHDAEFRELRDELLTTPPATFFGE